MEEILTKKGNLASWQAMKSIKFSKYFQLLDSTGKVEIDRTELHDYNFTEQTQRLIKWNEGDTIHELIQNEDLIYKSKNGKKDTLLNRKKLQNQINAASFVLGLPYTLDSPNASLKYKGVEVFEKFNAHTLLATFKNSNDRWYFYYNVETFDWLGYWVQTDGHFSLVINESMIEVDGHMLPNKRTSYRTTENKTKLYKRAVYEYSNYEIKS